MTLQLLHSEFPYILGKLDFLFYQCIRVKDPVRVEVPIRLKEPGGQFIMNVQTRVGGTLKEDLCINQLQKVSVKDFTRRKRHR
jgi:hypothetical protein